jgi:hypothetical protein
MELSCAPLDPVVRQVSPKDALRPCFINTYYTDSNFLSLESKYSSEHTVLKCPQSSISAGDHVSH